MIFDTDVMIWAQRGNGKAADCIERESERYISLFTYLELLQGASSKKEQKWVMAFMKEFEFVVLPLTERIGYRAVVYIEEYAPSHGLRDGDAIIAATAVEFDEVLMTGNKKHFAPIKGLQLKIFKP